MLDSLTQLIVRAAAGMTPEMLLGCFAALFVGAVIRGFTGFGSSLVWVPSLSLILPPVAIIPVTYMLEFGASAHLLPKVRYEADWPSLRRIWVGAALLTPVGQYLLAILPADVTRAAVAAIVLGASILLWRGTRFDAKFSAAETLSVGGLAGLLMGGVGLSGPAVFLYYLSTPLPIAISRASIITFLLGSAFFAIGFAVVQGLLGPEEVVRAAFALPVVLVGNYLGAHGFHRSDPDRARRYALIVLMMLGVVLLVRALVG